MNRDAFSLCHPAVNFLFFIPALGFGMMLQHPVYLLAGVLTAACYYLLLHGRRGIWMLLGMLPVCAAITVLNPLFNHRGDTVLFTLFGDPYTLEALVYGGALAGIFLNVLLWFGCYSRVMTGDKFTSLFGSVIPSLSLLLVMIFRMVPRLLQKARQIDGARRSVGKDPAGAVGLTEKLRSALTELGCLTTWALEGCIVTADSMRSRGYGAAKRTSFTQYRMTLRDWVLLICFALLSAAVLATALTGGTTATFTPEWFIAPISGLHTAGLLAYCILLLIPTFLHLEEALLWHISKSKI